MVAKKRVIEHKMHALNAQAELAAREGNADGVKMVGPTKTGATCVEYLLPPRQVTPPRRS